MPASPPEPSTTTATGPAGGAPTRRLGRRPFASFAPALALLLAALAPPRHASAKLDVEGLNIVEIRVLGNTTIPLEKVRQHIQSKEGRPFSERTAEGDRHRLAQAKMFDIDTLKYYTDLDKKRNGVVLTFVVEEMRKVAEIEFRGAQKIKVKELEERSGLKKNGHADHIKAMLAEKELQRLYEEKGYFYAEVKLIEGGKADDRRIVFQIFEGPKCSINEVRFEGNSFIPESTLKTKISSRRKLLGLIPGKFRSEDIEEDAKKLRDYYQGLGFFASKVSLVKRPGATPGEVILTYVIWEGPQFKVRNIKFEGNKLIPTEKLHAGMVMHSGQAFSDTLREADKKALTTKYGEIGCIDVEIEAERKFTDKADVVDLVYRIEEGEPYLLGHFEVRGNARTRSEVLRREAIMAGLVPGEPLNLTRLETYRKRVMNLNYFQTNPEMGKPVKIDLVNKRGPDQPFGRDLGTVGAGDVKDATQVHFQNPADPPVVVDVPAEVPAPGPAAGPNPAFGGPGVLDPPADAVAPIDVPRIPGDAPAVVAPGGPPGTRTPPVGEGEPPGFPSLPGTNTEPGPDKQEPFPNRSFVDLVTSVDEAPTGRFGLSVGVNSYQGLMGNVVIHERNFDLFAVPRTWEELFSGQAFRGRGQDLQISLSPGLYINSTQVSFTDPYAFGLPIGFSASGYAFQRVYPDWTEGRVGGKVALGRQFGTMIYADVAARVEDVDFHGFKFPAPADYPRRRRPHDALDPPLEHPGSTTGTTRSAPTRGPTWRRPSSRAEGTFTYPKFTVEGRQYITTGSRPDNTGKRFFTLRGMYGITGRDTPVYERFFAGDFRSMRGFAYRGVGPHELGVNVGGIMTALGSVEYQFPLTASDKLQQVVFCDFGTVESNYSFTTFRAAVGTGLRIYLPQQMFGNLPLAFDFGIPVVKADGDHTRLFTFFIGTFFGWSCTGPAWRRLLL